MRKALLLIILLSITTYSIAQTQLHQSQNLTVTKNNEILTNAWAGGLNVPQFSPIDLNQDGILDLFVFDKNGNQISCFINNGTSNTVDYHYAAEYNNAFPDLEGWALLRDYNCDGKNDLFTSKNGAIKLYENTSIGNNVSFEEIGTITTDRGNGPTNLYVSSVDIPHIGDLDNDGDLDILTFTVIGSHVEWHKNYSNENNFDCDSLQYLLEDDCWGDFSENFSNNSVSLDDCNKSSAKHSGSTVTALDLNGDEYFELLLGDITFDNIVMLENSAATDQALMVDQDTNFPSYNQSVSIPKFPATYYIDVNNDSKKDLIVSPNGTNVSINYNNSWYYNNSSTSVVELNLEQKDFLADKMIEVGSGAHPVFFDHNQDGLLDLIIANYGYSTESGNFNSQLALYENDGTASSPTFKWITDDFAELGNLNFENNLIPTFGDIDNDGDEDMLIGDSNGNIHLFASLEVSGEPIFFMSDPNYFDIDVGSFASPFLIDLDRDEDLDLLIGSRLGLIYYYENQGSAEEADFVLTNDTLGNINLIDPIFNTAYTTPTVIDTENGYELYIGTEKGAIHHYTNIDNNINGNYTEVVDTLSPKSQGIKTSVAVADLNGDDINDMIMGLYTGGLHLYLSDTSNQVGLENNLPVTLNSHPNPSTGVFHITHNNSIERVNIYNLKGQLLKSIYNTNSVNISDLEDGLYIINITDRNGNNFITKHSLIRK